MISEEWEEKLDFKGSSGCFWNRIHLFGVARKWLQASLCCVIYYSTATRRICPLWLETHAAVWLKEGATAPAGCCEFMPRMQALTHIWGLTSVILKLHVIRCSLVCCSQYRWGYFNKLALVLLSGDPTGGNVSGQLSQSVTFKGAVNRLNIAHLCLVFRRTCRWPFVIAPSVLKSQRSITANGDRNRLFNQIISRALRVRLSALRRSPHQTPAAERASPNAITAVAIVWGHLKSAYRRCGTSQVALKSLPFGSKCSGGFWNQIRWISLVTPTAALPLYLFIQGNVPPGPPWALHSEGVDQHLCRQLTQLDLKGQCGAAVGALWGRTTAMTSLSDLQRLSVNRQQIPGVSVLWPWSSSSFLHLYLQGCSW